MSSNSRADLAVETTGGWSLRVRPRRGARRRRAPSTPGTVTAGASRRRAAGGDVLLDPGRPRSPSGPRAPGPAARRPSPRPQRRRIAARRHRRGIIGAMSPLHERIRVGWIGTGVMGTSMCAHLLDAGHDVTVTSRTRAKADARLTRGGRWGHAGAGSPPDSDVVFAMVGYPDEVAAVVLGADGAPAGARGACSCPALGRHDDEPARRSRSRSPRRAGLGGVAALTHRSRAATSAPATARCRSWWVATPSLRSVRALLRRPGRAPSSPGAGGFGQHPKLTNQVLVAGTIVGVCEALLTRLSCRARRPVGARFRVERRRRVLGALEPRAADRRR